MPSPEETNYAAIERLERLLEELRGSASTARETEAIRETGLEIAIAFREVGTMPDQCRFEADVRHESRFHGRQP